MQAVLTTFHKPGAFERAYALLNILKTRFPQAENRFNVSAGNPGWQVTYIPAASEDVEDTIDRVDDAAQFAEGFRFALEEI